MDENKDITDSNRKRLKHNVNDLIRGKTTTEDIYKKYMRRAIKIKAKVNFQINLQKADIIIIYC